MNEEESLKHITFDTSAYSGEDLYSEGEAEDRLLEAVRKYPKEEYNRLIAESGSWSFLYHLSDLRGNIVDFLPIKKNHRVLEVGSGCGAITGTLAEKAGQVTCIELSRKRSLINAFRNDMENVTIRVGNFQDVEPRLKETYDYILLIGVLEYAGTYIQGPEPERELLTKLKGHLAEGGTLVVAIENQYGIKYFSGAAEDHTGRLYDGIEGYPKASGVRTYSRQALSALAEKTGFTPFFMYPWPDYKFPVTVYSDSYLPKPGDFTSTGLNFDADRFCAFDEAAAMNEAVRTGMFPLLSNSFLLLLRRKGEWENGEERVIFSRHSNERAPGLCIRTDITEEAEKRRVYKYPADHRAGEHLKKMALAFKKQEEVFAGTALRPNRCRVIEGAGAGGREFIGLEFEYLRGQTLEEALENAALSSVKAGNDEFKDEILHYTAIIRGLATEKFKITDGFKQIFGEPDLPEGLLSLPFSNVDLIFPNLIISGEGEELGIIDYEWCFDFPVPVDYMIYRSLRYCLASLGEKAPAEDIYALCGIGSESVKAFGEIEKAFQQWVSSGRFSLVRLDSIFGKNRVGLNRGMRLGNLIYRPERMKVYPDFGEGFGEDTAFFVNAALSEEDELTLKLTVPAGCRSLRIDPAERPCVLKIISLSSDGQDRGGKVNGLVLKDRIVYFDTADPQLLLEEVREGQELKLICTVGAVEERFREALGEALLDWKKRRSSTIQRLFGHDDGYTPV
ncbi:MAG: class I SAM-dependent methyltransferase [Lachnospiraceae bacterium]|nr:class I SAM-dependent methyltransferase [Lachnospiraceae bacterium]